MADRKWDKKAPGLFYRKPKRGPLKGQRVYGCRVWNKDRQACEWFNDLGIDRDIAKERMQAIAGNLREVLAERDRQPEPQQAELTMDVLIAKFLAGYESRGNSGYYAYPAKSWRDYFKREPVSSITTGRVAAYRDHLKRQKASARTIRKYVGSLSTMFRWARGEAEIMGWNEAHRWSVIGEKAVKLPEEPRELVEVLSHDEEKSLLEAADLRTRWIIELYLASGMRSAEGLRLEWGHIDQHGLKIHKTKTGRARVIPLNEQLSGVLERGRKLYRRTNSGDLVLADKKRKTPSRYQLDRMISSALEAAGINKDCGPLNLLRHTFGSRKAEAGVKMAVIAELMGNTEEVCRRHYIRFSPGYLKAAMAATDCAHTDPVSPKGPNREATDTSEVVAV